MSKIVFFNHYHRGDLLTHKEFIRQIKTELDGVEYEYMHFNHPKLTRDLDVPLTGDPTNLDPKTPFYQEEESLYINTWIGCHWDIFSECGGINMDSLMGQWTRIFQIVNECFGTNLVINPNRDYYLPKIDFSRFDVSRIDDYLEKNKDAKKILICNGAPKSGQSFASNMKEFLEPLALENTDTHFICTEKFSTDVDNILFTEDIILDKEAAEKRAPWEDRALNNCDLQEISYLSENCNAIVGKNSGPYVFCETYNNYTNSNKKFLSFNVSWGIGKATTETMSHNMQNFMKCDYKIIPVEGPHKGDLNLLTSDDLANINTALDTLVKSL
jgi:hypothetical protein